MKTISYLWFPAIPYLTGLEDTYYVCSCTYPQPQGHESAKVFFKWENISYRDPEMSSQTEMLTVYTTESQVINGQ